MIYYKLHIGDYTRDTAHLSLLEHGAYLRLMNVYYTRESPLEDATVERVVGARSSAEKTAVRTVLAEFFKLQDGQWFHDRCEEEIRRHGVKSEIGRQYGKLGGRPRKETQTVADEKGNENPNGFEKETQTKAIPDPISQIQDQEPLSAAELDPRKRLFDLGVSILGANSRSLISKAIKHAGEEKVGAILGEMALSSKAEPKAYFVKATAPKARAFW